MVIELKQVFDPTESFEKRCKLLSESLDRLSDMTQPNQMRAMMRWLLFQNAWTIPLRRISKAYAWEYKGPELLVNPYKAGIPINPCVSQKEAIEFIARFSSLHFSEVERIIGTQTINLELAGNSKDHINYLVVTVDSIYRYRNQSNRPSVVSEASFEIGTLKLSQILQYECGIPVFKTMEAEQFYDIYLAYLGMLE